MNIPTPLQEELVKLQESVKENGLKVMVIFKGRDAAGKGAPSSASGNTSIPASAGWWPWTNQPKGSRDNGTSNAGSPPAGAGGDRLLRPLLQYDLTLARTLAEEMGVD